MILEEQKKTLFYNCLAISGWICIIAFFKYLVVAMIQMGIIKRLFPVLMLQVSVVATVGLAIAILLMVIESFFPIELPPHKFLDAKLADKIYSIGFYAECLFFIPVLVIIFTTVIMPSY